MLPVCRASLELLPYAFLTFARTFGVLCQVHESMFASYQWWTNGQVCVHDVQFHNSSFLSIAHQAVSGLLVLSIHVCFELQKGHTLCAKKRCKHMNTDKHKTHEMMTIGSTYKPLQTFSCSPQKKQRALLVVPNSAASSTAIVLSSWGGKGNTGTSDSYIEQLSTHTDLVASLCSLDAPEWLCNDSHM